MTILSRVDICLPDFVMKSQGETTQGLFDRRIQLRRMLHLTTHDMHETGQGPG